jgi:NAD(P)-dependent dehydrogenase (short-subunit alcohol dehydrogenase family)
MASVLITSRTRSAGAATVELFRELGAEVLTNPGTKPAGLPDELFVAADLTTPGGAAALAAAARERWVRSTSSCTCWAALRHLRADLLSSKMPIEFTN